MRAPLLLSFLSLIVLGTASGCAGPRSTGPAHATESAMPPRQTPVKVVLISLDGLRPEFYESASFDAPTLRSLASRGAHARGVVPIFPSLTYPVHTSMVTGVSSARHGVLANYLFSMTTGPSTDWYWDADRIRVPTLWDRVRAAGKTTAIVRWPVSRGARVDWLIPEVFHSPGIHPQEDWELVRQNTRPELWQEVRQGSHLTTLRSLKDVDDFTTEAALRIIEDRHPDLTLIHLINVDFEQHATGRDSTETHAAVATVDRMIRRIVEAADLSRSVVIVTGDHGFMDFHREVNVNRLFLDRGWIHAPKGKLKDWQVVAQADGGQAAIYLRDPRLAPEVIHLLRRKAQGMYRIISRPELDRLQAYPGAICALEASEDYVLNPKLNDPWMVRLDKTHGHHGYLPTHPQIQTGFIAIGAGIPQGVDLGVIQIVDVAPTVASLLQVEMPDTEGRSVMPIAMDKAEGNNRAPLPHGNAFGQHG